MNSTRAAVVVAVVFFVVAAGRSSDAAGADGDLPDDAIQRCPNTRATPATIQIMVDR